MAGDAEWRAALEAAGVVVDGAAADLAVGNDRRAEAPSLVVEGTDARRMLRRRGYGADAYLALPGLAAATLFVPLGRPGVARYAIESWTFPRARWKRIRNRAAARLADAGLRPPGTEVVTVASREPGRPYLVAAAQAAGFLDPGGWFLVGGQGDALSRGAFFVFPPGGGAPAWVLKFARVPGYREPFDRDERGLALVAAAGGMAAARAPSTVGRFTAGGVEAAVETAAAGKRLSGLLRSAAPRAEKLALVEAVARWIVAVEVETASSGGADAELERLRREVLPQWSAPADLAARAAGVPGVLLHHDLGSWNVVAGKGGFTVVDWESARRFGLPLWDLWYFLADALAQVDCRTDAERVGHFERLFRGDAPSSDLLFRWTREGAAALRLPDSTVGPLATLCWLHHGLSRAARERSLATHAGAAAGRTWAAETYAATWLSAPGLGPGWDRWRR